MLTYLQQYCFVTYHRKDDSPDQIQIALFTWIEVPDFHISFCLWFLKSTLFLAGYIHTSWKNFPFVIFSEVFISYRCINRPALVFIWSCTVNPVTFTQDFNLYCVKIFSFIIIKEFLAAVGHAFTKYMVATPEKEFALRLSIHRFWISTHLMYGSTLRIWKMQTQRGMLVLRDLIKMRKCKIVKFRFD